MSLNHPFYQHAPWQVQSLTIIRGRNKTGFSCLFLDICNNGNDMCVVTLYKSMC